MEHAEDSFGEELAARLDADIDIGDGWLDALRVGVRTADRDQQVNWSTYNWGSVQPLWGLQNDVPLFLNQGLWQGTYTPIDLGPNQVGGGVFGGGTFLHPRFDIVNNYQATQRSLRQRQQQQLGGAGGTRLRGPDQPERAVLPGRKLDVVEDTRAAYVMLKFGGDDTTALWHGRQGQHRRSLRDDRGVLRPVVRSSRMYAAPSRAGSGQNPDPTRLVSRRTTSRS